MASSSSPAPTARDAGPAGSTVEVVVPTLNNAGDLERCLAALARQEHPSFSVLVVDSHSTDRTPAVADAVGARYLDTDTTTRADACNAAIAATTAEIVVFTDDDCIPPPHWLGQLAGHFADPRVDSVGGPSFAPPWQPLLARAADVAMAARGFTLGTRYGRQGGELAEIDHNSGCNAAYRRSALEAAGGFPAGSTGCEDAVLDARLAAAGRRIWYDPSAWTHHRRRETVSGLWRMGRSYGRGRANAGRLDRALVRPVHWLPSVALLLTSALCAAGLLSAVAAILLRSPPAWVAALATLPALALAGFVGFAWLGAALGGSPHRTPATVLLSPLPLAILIGGYGAGFLEVAASRGEPATSPRATPDGLEPVSAGRRARGR